MTSRAIIENILNLGYEDVKIIVTEEFNKENYKLLSVEYDNDFLTIFKSQACVDLLFTPNNRQEQIK